MKPSSAHTTLAGLLWTFLGTGARGLVQLLVLAVLARLLTIADFGVITLATVIVGISADLSHFSIGPAVVQLPDIETRHMRVGFTLSLLLGIVLLIVMWWIAPLLAGFFRLEALTPVLRVMALLFPLQGAFTVAESLLQRQMSFRLLAVIDATTYAVGYGLVAIALALGGFGFWSFVGGYCAQGVARTVLLLIVQPHPMRPLLERRALSQLLRFSGGLILGRIGNYVASQGDSAIVGRSLGAEALGLYGRALQLMVLPAMFVGEILDKVLFPRMARYQDNNERLRVAYGRAVGLIALLVLPTSVGLLILAPQIVAVLLGPKWSDVVAPLQIFAGAMLFRTSYKISDATVRATGAVYRRAWRQAIYAALVLAGAWGGYRWGLPGVATGVAAAILINYLLMAQLILAITGMSWGRFWNAHRPGLAVAVAVAVQVELVSAVLKDWGASPGVVLIASTATILVSLPLLLRCAPDLFLGQHGIWMLQTMSPYTSWRPRADVWPGRPRREAARYRRGAARRPHVPQRTVIVEFAGLPGAGKTALAGAVAQRLRERGIPAEEVLSVFAASSGLARTRKAGWVLSRVLRRPGYAYRCARAIVASRQRSAADAAKVLHNWLLISFLINERGSGGGIVLFDQGIFQALWSIGYSAGNGILTNVFDRLRMLAVSPHLVVIVETSPVTAARRLTARPFGRSRLERLPVGDRHQLIRAAKVWEEVRETLTRSATAEHGGTQIIVVDNDPEGRVGTNALALADHIQHLHDAGPSAAPPHRTPQYSGAGE